MRKLAVGVVIAMLAASVPAGAATGTCTITAMRQPNLNLGLIFTVGAGVGVAMPVTFDESAGAFSMARDTWYDTFGELGAQYGTVAPTIHGYLRMFDGSTSGTVDASGQVRLPSFPLENSTDYQQSGCPADVNACPDYPIVGVDLMTGLQVRVLSQKTYVLEGTPIDFGTGAVKFYGAGTLSGSVGSSGDNLSGVEMTCTLAPIPTQTALPAGASLEKSAGKLKLDTSPEAGDKGDTLTLKTKLVPGSQALDLSGAAPLIVRVGDLTVVVRGGNFQVKGKKLLVKRDDTCKVKKGAAAGVCRADKATACTTFADCEPLAKLEVVSGRKAVGEATSQLGGQLLIANGKGGATVTLKLQGLDLATLTGAQTLRTALGPVNARQAVTISGTTLK